MRVRTKQTNLTDGSVVHDINLFPNGQTWTEGRKVIISCITKENADEFLTKLGELLEKYTVESLELER